MLELQGQWRWPDWQTASCIQKIIRLIANGTSAPFILFNVLLQSGYIRATFARLPLVEIRTGLRSIFCSVALSSPLSLHCVQFRQSCDLKNCTTEAHLSQSSYRIRQVGISEGFWTYTSKDSIFWPWCADLPIWYAILISSLLSCYIGYDIYRISDKAIALILTSSLISG